MDLLLARLGIRLGKGEAEEGMGSTAIESTRAKVTVVALATYARDRTAGTKVKKRFGVR